MKFKVIYSAVPDVGHLYREPRYNANLDAKLYQLVDTLFKALLRTFG